MKEKMTYLFRQYLHNTSTEKELEEFLYLIDQAGSDPILRELIREVYDHIQEGITPLDSYIDEKGGLVLNSWNPSDPPPEKTFPLTRSPGTWNRLLKNKLLFTASLLGIVALVSFWWINRSPNPHKQSLASVVSLTKKFTGVSEEKFLLLSDSTQVWLNGNSSLEFPDEFSGKKREVYLAGEAWFEVKNAEQQPFIIHTGNITTAVLGTSFNIKAYPYLKSVMVSVSKGKVRVSREDQVVAVLEIGQQVKISQVDSLVKQKNIDAGTVAFWKQGYISYDDEKIGEIVQDLAHFNNVSIIVKDSSLLDTRITTSFSRSIGVEQELRLICKLIDKQLTVNNGQYIIE